MEDTTVVAPNLIGVPADTPTDWLDLLRSLAPGRTLRPVQQQAIAGGLLYSRKNVIVAAPTNSGKSLIGMLVLLEALRAGKRAVLIEPLRALANEQAEQLKQQLAGLSNLLGSQPAVKVTTGDYRLQDEEFSDPAPQAELIVCTPERLDAILRNPDNSDWVESIGAVVLDEAHLIADSRRGPTQEFLLTSLLMLPAPPRLVLLSATLGNVDRIREWLAPCEVFQVTERHPPLHKSVIEPPADRSANDTVVDWLWNALVTPEHQALVFVYQTRSTESLATELTEQLGPLAGSDGAMAYHGKMSSAQREEARRSFLEGRSRVVVTTSALALGVNLPATHVVVRDLTYHGVGTLDVSDLLQMMGRAGRGDQEGYAVVIKKPSDDWTTADLQQALDEERLPPFRSAFADDAASSIEPASAIPVVATLLARSGDEGQTQEMLERFLVRSLGGTHLVGQVGPALHWLERQILAWQDGDHYRLTVLGRRAVRSVLPLPLAAGLAQLLRDLLSIDPDDRLLGAWRELDHLLVLHLLYANSPSLRRYSQALSEQVAHWCGGTPTNTPMLFREWIDGEKGHSRAHEIIASLGLQPPAGARDRNEWARQQAYLATSHGIILLERGRGRSIEQLGRQYKVQNLEGIEERWRDDMLWLLTGVSRLLEIRTFYYHLREECAADPERIKRVKRLLGRMRHQVYDVQEKLKYCSPLGPALRDIRRLTGGGVGVQTIRRLEDAGITDLQGLSELGYEGMLSLGVRRDISKRIQRYLRRRAV